MATKTQLKILLNRLIRVMPFGRPLFGRYENSLLDSVFLKEDDNLLDLSKKIYFGDIGVYIYSQSDGKLYISADGTDTDDITFDGTTSFLDWLKMQYGIKGNLGTLEIRGREVSPGVGKVVITGGNAYENTQTGGDAEIHGGNGRTTGDGGKIYLYGGDGGNNGNGGDIQILSGGATGVKYSGNCIIGTGSSPAGTAGEFYIKIGGNEVWMINTSKTLLPLADNTNDIGNLAVNPRDIHVSRSLVKKGIANSANGYGQLAVKSISASVTCSGGATENIAVQVPSGAKIIGCQLRNNTAITFGGGGATYSAAYNTGATQSIGSGIAETLNTKTNKFFDSNAATDITSAATDITLTPNAGTLATGTVEAVVYYYELTSMINFV